MDVFQPVHIYAETRILVVNFGLKNGLILCNGLAYTNQLYSLYEILNTPFNSLDFYVDFDYEDSKSQSDFNTISLKEFSKIVKTDGKWVFQLTQNHFCRHKVK